MPDLDILQMFFDRFVADGLSPSEAFAETKALLNRVCHLPWDTFYLSEGQVAIVETLTTSELNDRQ